MYLLFECGTCTKLYQLQDEKFVNTLQKLTCSSCQTFYYFGPMDDSKKDVTSPTIEKIVPASGLKPFDDSGRSPNREIYWKCGTCESSYHFNLNRVTNNGIKITCPTCFQYFILEKTASIVDLDHLVMQEIPDDLFHVKTNIKDKFKGLPPTIESNEISEEMDQTPPSMVEVRKELKSSRDAFGAEETTVTSVRPSESPDPMPVTKMASIPEEPIEEEPIITKGPLAPVDLEPFFIRSEPKAIPLMQENDIHMIHSFKSFNLKKMNYKISKANENSTITFIESTHTQKSYLEKNMTKISLWVAVISAIGFVGAIGYEKYKTKREDVKLQQQAPKQDQQSANPNRPKYGFPQLTE